jgi:hypothetical protein
MVRRRLTSGLGLLVALVLVAGLSSRLASPIPIAQAAAPALEGTPDEQLTVAADKIAAATAKGGSGFTFTVVSRSTLYQKEGGPLIEVPDPADPYKVGGLATEYYLGADIAEGIVTPAGYFLQMRAGPATKDEAPDFEKAEPTLAALVSDGKTYRNDGEGWYETADPPGIGLDPATIALLPSLLRDARDPTAEGTREVDGSVAAAIKATGDMAKAPGLMAIDAEAFTELGERLTFALDAQGRLVEIGAVMRNTKVETFDLLVETVITIRYPVEPPTLPEPEPLLPDGPTVEVMP